MILSEGLVRTLLGQDQGHGWTLKFFFIYHNHIFQIDFFLPPRWKVLSCIVLHKCTYSGSFLLFVLCGRHIGYHIQLDSNSIFRVTLDDEELNTNKVKILSSTNYCSLFLSLKQDSLHF